jgi:pimeloyl-ACP methyl ester carboxylesterase
VEMGLLSTGVGPPLLLVHGGAGQIERWLPLWDRLSVRRHVTAMDRRGRGSSGDGLEYSIEDEYQDVAAVAESLAKEAGRPICVFAHSYGATCTLGAASRAAPFDRIVLYEPPAKQTVSLEFVERLDALLAQGSVGGAMVTFMKEIIGLTNEEVDELTSAPPTFDILSVGAATLSREAHALLEVDLPRLVSGIGTRSLFLLGERSPEWAQLVTLETAHVMANSQVSALAGLGHESIDVAPERIADELASLLS